MGVFATFFPIGRKLRFLIDIMPSLYYIVRTNSSFTEKGGYIVRRHVYSKETMRENTVVGLKGMNGISLALLFHFVAEEFLRRVKTWPEAHGLLYFKPRGSAGSPYCRIQYFEGSDGANPFNVEVHRKSLDDGVSEIGWIIDQIGFPPEKNSGRVRNILYDRFKIFVLTQRYDGIKKRLRNIGRVKAGGVQT